MSDKKSPPPPKPKPTTPPPRRPGEYKEDRGWNGGFDRKPQDVTDTRVPPPPDKK